MQDKKTCLSTMFTLLGTTLQALNKILPEYPFQFYTPELHILLSN